MLYQGLQEVSLHCQDLYKEILYEDVVNDLFANSLSTSTCPNDFLLSRGQLSSSCYSISKLLTHLIHTLWHYS